MERKFQMSSILPLCSEITLLLAASWNLNSSCFCWELPGCGHLFSSLLLTSSVLPFLLNHFHPHTNMGNVSHPTKPAIYSTPSQAIALFFVPLRRNTPWKGYVHVLFPIFLFLVSLKPTVFRLWLWPLLRGCPCQCNPNNLDAKFNGQVFVFIWPSSSCSLLWNIFFIWLPGSHFYFWFSSHTWSFLLIILCWFILLSPASKCWVSPGSILGLTFSFGHTHPIGDLREAYIYIELLVFISSTDLSPAYSAFPLEGWLNLGSLEIRAWGKSHTWAYSI